MDSLFAFHLTNSKGDGVGARRPMIVGDQFLLLAYRGHFLHKLVVEAPGIVGRGGFP